jgi:hypothetical protein
MAEKLNEEELQSVMKDGLSRYLGTHIPEIADDWELVLNEVFPIIQYELPTIFFRNPRVFIKPRNKTFIAKKRDPVSGSLNEVILDSSKSAKTQEALLNYILSEIKYKKEVRKVLLDALVYPYGVLWHGYKGNFGMTEEQSLFIKNESLFVKRISPLKFLKDPSVNISEIDEGNWIGRSFEIPLNDLIEDENLDIDKKELKGKVGFGQKIGRSEQTIKQGGIDFVLPSSQKALVDYTSEEYRKSNLSRFVTVYEIFLRPSKKDARNGEKGKIVLLTDEQTKPLRTSRWPYKAEGWPAHILQFNEVSDTKFGLSDIDTYSSIADQKNSIINQQLRNAKQLNKVWVGLSREDANQEDIQKAQVGDNTIITFEGGNPAQKMYVASGAGGASSELYLLDQRIDRNLQDKSGISDLKKGFLQSGEESATSVQLRAAGSSARPAYRQDIMAEFLKDSCHFLNQLNKQFMPIEDAVRIVGTLDIQWSENPSKEEIQADTDVEIDVISMLPENPEQELKEMMTVLNLATNAVQNPALAQKIAMEGKTINLSPLIEKVLYRLKIRDPEVFRNIRPEESEGFVSVSEVRAAKANVQAALAGQPPPSPPAEGQDHKARLEVYGSIAEILQGFGNTQALQILTELIQIQMTLLQTQMEKEAPKEYQPVNLNKSQFGVKPVGAS